MKKTFYLLAFAAILFSCNLIKESEPVLSVSADKMNVLYIGVDNPITIAVSDVTNENIKVKISKGEIRGSNGKYIVRVKEKGSVTIEVSDRDKRTGTADFRVKSFPDPYATIGGKKYGKVTKEFLLSQKQVDVTWITDFDWGDGFKVIKFTVSANIDGFTMDDYSQSNKITDSQKDLINALNPGCKVYIEEIVAVGPDGIERKLGVIMLEIIE